MNLYWIKFYPKWNIDIIMIVDLDCKTNTKLSNKFEITKVVYAIYPVNVI